MEKIQKKNIKQRKITKKPQKLFNITVFWYCNFVSLYVKKVTKIRGIPQVRTKGFANIFHFVDLMIEYFTILLRINQNYHFYPAIS